MFPRTNFQHQLIDVCGRMAGQTVCGMIRIHKAQEEESRKGLVGEEMVSSLKMSLFIPAKECFLCLVALASSQHTCCKQHLRTYWSFLMVLWRETSLDSQQLPLFRRDHIPSSCSEGQSL